MPIERPTKFLERLSPHDFRHTFVGDLLDAGADIVTVQCMAGHAGPPPRPAATTVAASAHKAASLLHVPYVRRSSKTDSSS